MAEPPHSPIELVDDVADLLGHRRRIEMLQLLSGGTMSSEELGDAMDLTPAATRYHLGRLHRHGWVYVAETVVTRGPGEKRWSAVPGIDWRQQAEAINALCQQRQPRADS